MKKESLKSVSAALFISFSLCSCASNKNLNDPQVSIETEDYFEGKTKLVYLNTVPYGNADYAIQNELNKILDNRGLDFAIEFVDIEEIPDGSNSCLSVYEKMLENGQQIDIVFTGVSLDSSTESTYSQFIEKGYLEPFNDYFDTEIGQKFYDQFDEKYWDRMTYGDGKIYGKSAAYTISAPLSLHINSDNFNISDFDGTFDSLIDVIESVTWKTGSPSLLLEPGDIAYENYFGFTKYKGIFINCETGLAENIFENHEFIEYFKTISELVKNGCATTNSELIKNDSLVAYIGTYNYLLSEKNDVIIGNSYYDNFGISSATGISAYSQHKDEAVEFLSLLNTDDEISTLLYNGIEGRNYKLKDGHAVGIPESSMAYCVAALTPANPIIAIPKEEESNNKQANLDYQTEYVKKSPAYGLNYENGKLDDIAKIYDEYYGLFFGSYENVDAALEDANHKLNEMGLTTILEDLNNYMEVQNGAESY